MYNIYVHLIKHSFFKYYIYNNLKISLTPSAPHDLGLSAGKLVLLSIAEGIDETAGHADVEVSELVLVFRDLKS
jgi:hypothetical protein